MAQTGNVPLGISIPQVFLDQPVDMAFVQKYVKRAEQLGYKVLVAEGSPIVLKIIVEGYVDAIVGVACLNVLEKAIDKILLAGVPCFAIPLHSGDCKNTTLDESWVWEILEEFEPLAAPETRSYVPLMREANSLFNNHFDRLLPRTRSQTPLVGLCSSCERWLLRWALSSLRS